MKKKIWKKFQKNVNQKSPKKHYLSYNIKFYKSFFFDYILMLTHLNNLFQIQYIAKYNKIII
jgi:hypothetical protein